MSKFEIPSTKKSFVLNNEHADMIVNDLLQGEYETLGRIFTDLVNYNLYGDESIIESSGEDKAERTARRLLRSDSEQYISNWIARSQQNAKNRKSEQYPNNDEVREYARSKGYDEEVAMSWCMEKTRNDWIGQDGKPIKYWKKNLDSYMQGINRNRINEMSRNIGR